MIDETPTGELDGVPSKKFKDVADACTLCDICFVNKCPYVPPHGHNIDFPRLMLRHRIVEQQSRLAEKHVDVDPYDKVYGSTLEPHQTFPVSEGISKNLELRYASTTKKLKRDLHDVLQDLETLYRLYSVIPNFLWNFSLNNSLFRKILNKVQGIHTKAAIPEFSNRTYLEQASQVSSHSLQELPYTVILFASCMGNFSKTEMVKGSFQLC